MRKIYLYLFSTVLFLGCVNTAFAVNWIKKNSSFPADLRGGAVSFVIKGKAYVGTGYIYKNNNNVFFKDFWQYDPATETWTRIADFPGEARYNAISFSADGKGYVGLGRNNDSGNLKDFYEYNPDNNTWIKIADFPDARSGAVAFVINDIGYIGTGYDAGLKSDFYKYQSGRWTAVASLPSDEARDQATAYALNGKGYIVSGGLGPVLGGIDSIWEYDPVTNTWQRAGRLSFASNILHSYVSDNTPYVVAFNDLYKYNAENNWFYPIASVFSSMDYISNQTFFVIHNVPYMILGTYGGIFNPTGNPDLWYDADAVKSTDIKSLPVETFSVYPNPVNDYFVVSGMSGAQISISDLTGRFILKKSNIGDKETISVFGWQRGVYLLTIKKDENSITGKLIVQ